jgi:hypothetical protein
MSGFNRPFRMPMLVWITRLGSRLSGCPRPMRRTAPYVNRQSPLISVGGLFHFAITTVSSRAEVLDVNARFAGLGLPGVPNCLSGAAV